MSFFNEFPHTHTYDSDLAWLIKRMKELIEQMIALRKDIDDLIASMPDLIDQGIEATVADGRFEGWVRPLLVPIEERIDAINVVLTELNDWKDNLIVDNLTSTSNTNALSANMGRELKALIDALTASVATQIAAVQGQIAAVQGEIPDVINNLTSDSTTDALSAAQGKELKRLIDTSQQVVQVINNLTSTSTTDALSANMGRELKALIDAIPTAIAVIDDLTSTSTNSALSANQGRVLKGMIDNIVIPPATTVVDNLTSTSATSALSANQGRVLKSQIDAKPNAVNNLTSDSTTDALSAAQGKALKTLIDNVPQVPVINNLTSDSTTAALSAAQGKALKSQIDGLVIPPATQVINNLTSTSATAALSANQGKVLDGKRNWKYLGTLENGTSVTIPADAKEIYVQSFSDFIIPIDLANEGTEKEFALESTNVNDPTTNINTITVKYTTATRVLSWVRGKQLSLNIGNGNSGTQVTVYNYNTNYTPPTVVHYR